MNEIIEEVLETTKRHLSDAELIFLKNVLKLEEDIVNGIKELEAML